MKQKCEIMINDLLYSWTSDISITKPIGIKPLITFVSVDLFILF
jgi:hypothetical protein